MGTKKAGFDNAGFSFTFGRTRAEIFEYDDAMMILQALRMLHARDVTSSTHAPTRGRDVIEFPSFQRFHVDGRKTIQIRVDALFLKMEKKSLRFQKHTDTSG